MQGGRRGPYKRYLNDPNVAMPRMTAWRRGMPDNQHVPADPQHNEPEAPVEAEEGMDVDAASDQSSRTPSVLSEGQALSDAEHDNGMQDMALNAAAENVGSDVNSEDDSADEIGNSESSDSSDNHEDEDGVVESEGSDRDSEANEEEVLDPLHPNNENQPEMNNLIDDNNQYVRGPPLYVGCPVSQEESDILIMSFLIRWGLEDKCISELLKLIECHMPVPMMGSKYLFLRKFSVPDLSKLRFTCSECMCLMPIEFQQGECDNCGTFLLKDKLKDSGHFFLELSITEQLKRILQNRSVFPLLRKECEERDVVSGRVYQVLRDRGIIGDNDITLQWNTDGVSLFKSTKAQVWPIQACINELPYHARRDNMILCGLYFGKKKPNFDSFLKPFVNELEELHSDGFHCTFPGEAGMTLVKVHTILSSVDSVARAALQGIKQFNGSYGCSFCLRRGMRIDRGNGQARVYAGDRGVSRTITQHTQAVQELLEYNERHRVKKTHVQGVTRPSVILELSVFNVTTSFVPDYMHSALEGVVKLFLKHWCDYTYRETDWYLNKQKRRLLSEKIQAIMPPVEITRAPRGFDALCVMKASELRHFLLYYSLPCLSGILPARYLKHWLLFVYSITIYLRESFYDEEASMARRALQKFVQDIGRLYPDCIHLYTFNVHLLLHIPRAVKQFGGLWASSTFPYEHFNGVIARLITGTRYIPEQVTRSYLRLRQISEAGSKVFSDPNCSVIGKNLFGSLISKYRSSKFSVELGDGLRFFGAPEMYHLSVVERHAVQQLLNEGDVYVEAQSYRRMKFFGTIYHAGSYEALKVRNNSIVKLRNNRIMFVSHILRVSILPTYDQKCVILGEELDPLDEILCQDREINISSRSLVEVCRRTNRVMCELPINIFRKCVLIPYGNADCVIPLVNLIERD